MRGPVALAAKTLDRRLLIIGDSVMLGAQDDLVARLGSTGWQVTPVLAESLHTYDAPALVDENRQAVGDVVVIGLGTNDGQTPEQLAGWIDDLMDHVRGVKRVYWVNLPQFADWVPAANAEIAAARKRWRRLRVIDWGARADADPASRYADGIHLTVEGRAAITDLVGATLDEYAGVAPPTTTPGPAATTAPTAASSTSPPKTTSPRASAAHDDSDNTVAVVALSAVAALGAGILAIGWARRPRGKYAPRGDRRRPPPRRRGPGGPPVRRPPVSRPPRVHRSR